MASSRSDVSLTPRPRPARAIQTPPSSRSPSTRPTPESVLRLLSDLILHPGRPPPDPPLPLVPEAAEQDPSSRRGGWITSTSPLIVPRTRHSGPSSRSSSQASTSSSALRVPPRRHSSSKPSSSRTSSSTALSKSTLDVRPLRNAFAAEDEDKESEVYESDSALAVSVHEGRRPSRVSRKFGRAIRVEDELDESNTTE